PYLAVGWFWFLVTLAPVSGLIALGDHAMADRYTYVPLIGLFVALVWGAAELIASWGASESCSRRREEAEVRAEPQHPPPYVGGYDSRPWNLALGSMGVVLILLLAVAARAQLRYWSSSRALLERDLAVAGESAMVRNNLSSV